MSGLGDHLETRAGDASRELFRQRERRHLVVGARDHERGRLHLGKERAAVEVPARDQVRVTDARVGLHLLHPCLAHEVHAGRGRERLGGELLREASPDHVTRRLDRLRLQREADTGAREDEPVQAFPVPRGDHEADAATHAASDQDEGPQAERLGEADDQIGVRLDGR